MPPIAWLSRSRPVTERRGLARRAVLGPHAEQGEDVLEGGPGRHGAEDRLAAVDGVPADVEAARDGTAPRLLAQRRARLHIGLSRAARVEHVALRRDAGAHG